MTNLTEIIGQLVGQFFADPIVVLALRLVAFYLCIVWLACAWWTFRDLRRRTRDPFAPWLAAAGVLLLTPLAFPLALVLYHVVRPPETVAERAAGDLEQVLLHAEAQHARCPACAQPVDDGWVRCPSCGTVLAMPCPRCARNAGLDWEICAWCAADLPWAAVPAPMPDGAALGMTPAHAASIAPAPLTAAPGTWAATSSNGVPGDAARDRPAGGPVPSIRDLAGSILHELRRAGEGMMPPPEAVRWNVGGARMPRETSPAGPAADDRRKHEQRRAQRGGDRLPRTGGPSGA